MAKPVLQVEFEKWLPKQSKTRGDGHYTEKVVPGHVDAIRNVLKRLNFSDISETDLFLYTSLDDFWVIYQRIINSDNFTVLARQVGHYKKPLELYAEFMKDYFQVKTWIFQGNPKRYNIIEAIKNLKEIEWRTPQHSTKIKKGDKVYIWMSGPGGGIVATGTVKCNPVDRRPDQDDPYLLGHSLDTEIHKAVDIIITRNLFECWHIIPRSILKENPDTCGLAILSQPQSTNFAITMEEDTAIEGLLNAPFDDILPPIKVPTQTVTENPNQKALDRFKEEISYRRAITGKTVTPRQAPIQNRLSVQLAAYFAPQGYKVVPEDNRVDISLTSPNGSVTFIEIKPANSARNAIRQAIGQLLEYAHFPAENKAQRLIVVSDAELSPSGDEKKYLSHLSKLYGISIDYIHWPQGCESLPETSLDCFQVKI